MSRKRDTNWTRDEITVLLDSIMEITKTRAEGGKRTNSREVFEFAAVRLGEKGHVARAEREKCRTKWKKMKEEFTHAKRARDGDTRYKEAPGIQPFYERMEEFVSGNFDNISPHSTIVRRSSSISSQTTNNTTKSSQASRSSARIAANTNGTSSSNDNADTCSSIALNKTSNVSPVYSSSSAVQTPSTSSSIARQNSRLSCDGNNSSISNNNNSTNNLLPSTTVTASTTTNSIPTEHNHQQQAISNGELCTIYSSYTNNGNRTMNSVDSSHLPTDQADISYRVSTGCRQITIFGDHDVDIKFRGDCVTINKISSDNSNRHSLLEEEGEKK